jgi:ribonuclease BN (tRNA processing enzyme)
VWGVKLYVAGAGGSYPPPGFAGPCFLLGCKGRWAVLDFGEACLSRLLEAGISPCSIDLVFISHAHHDHWAGLQSLAVARVAEECGGLRLWLPWYSGDHPLRAMMPRKSEILVYRGSEMELCEDARLILWPVIHSVETYGVLLESSRSPLLAYTSDTAYDKSLSERVKGVKVLLGEATLPNGLEGIAMKEKHMTVAHLIRLAEESGAEILVPVHLSPYSLEEIRRLEPHTFRLLVGERFWLNL